MWSIIGHIYTVSLYAFAILSFLLAVSIIVLLICRHRRIKRLTIGEWCRLLLCCAYSIGLCVLCLISPSIAEQVIGTLSAAALVLSRIFSRYYDRISGIRWWTQ